MYCSYEYFKNKNSFRTIEAQIVQLKTWEQWGSAKIFWFL